MVFVETSLSCYFIPRLRRLSLSASQVLAAFQISSVQPALHPSFSDLRLHRLWALPLNLRLSIACIEFWCDSTQSLSFDVTLHNLRSSSFDVTLHNLSFDVTRHNLQQRLLEFWCDFSDSWVWCDSHNLRQLSFWYFSWLLLLRNPLALPQLTQSPSVLSFDVISTQSPTVEFWSDSTVFCNLEPSTH